MSCSMLHMSISCISLYYVIPLASAPTPAKQASILKVDSGEKPASVSSYYRRAPASCQSNKLDVIPTLSMGTSDSEGK